MLSRLSSSSLGSSACEASDSLELARLPFLVFACITHERKPLVNPRSTHSATSSISARQRRTRRAAATRSWNDSGGPLSGAEPAAPGLRSKSSCTNGILDSTHFHTMIQPSASVKSTMHTAPERYAAITKNSPPATPLLLVAAFIASIVAALEIAIVFSSSFLVLGKEFATRYHSDSTIHFNNVYNNPKQLLQQTREMRSCFQHFNIKFKHPVPKDHRPPCSDVAGSRRKRGSLIRVWGTHAIAFDWHQSWSLAG